MYTPLYSAAEHLFGWALYKKCITIKESVNQASRQASGTTHIMGTQSAPSIPNPSTPDDNPIDAAEYCDAICDVEPIHPVCKSRVQKSLSNPEADKTTRPSVVAMEMEKCGTTTQRSHLVPHSEGLLGKYPL